MKSTGSKKKKPIEASQDGILLLDADTGAIMAVNLVLTRKLGFSRKELLGKKLWEIQMFENANAFKDAMEAWGKEDYVHYGDLPLISKDGHLFKAESVFSVSMAGREKVIQCTIHHITRRPRVKEARRVSDRQMQALMSSLEDVIIEMDGEGTYLNIWTGNESLLTKPRAEMLGRSALEILGDELAGKVLESCRRVLARGEYEDIEYPLDVIAGRRWFLARVNPVPSEHGNAKTVCMLVRDITNHKRIEDSLLRSEAVLREQSVRDHLTGLFNRRYMEETLERELLRAARKHLSVGIIMLDVDGFKGVNDAFGHSAGDEVLRELGRLLHMHVRGEDIPSRYGGDEFIVVLPDASGEMTRQRAELLCKQARHLKIQYEGQALAKISISVGIAAFPDNGATAEEVLKAADVALYRAKEEKQGSATLAE